MSAGNNLMGGTQGPGAGLPANTNVGRYDPRNMRSNTYMPKVGPPSNVGLPDRGGPPLGGGGDMGRVPPPLPPHGKILPPPPIGGGGIGAPAAPVNAGPVPGREIPVTATPPMRDAASSFDMISSPPALMGTQVPAEGMPQTFPNPGLRGGGPVIGSPAEGSPGFMPAGFNPPVVGAGRQDAPMPPPPGPIPPVPPVPPPGVPPPPPPPGGGTDPNFAAKKLGRGVYAPTPSGQTGPGAWGKIKPGGLPPR